MAPHLSQGQGLSRGHYRVGWLLRPSLAASTAPLSSDTHQSRAGLALHQLRELKP